VYKYPRIWPCQRSGNCGPSSSSFFCVLRRLMLASLLCRNCLSELLFSRLVFDFKSSLRRHLLSCFCYLHLLPSLPLPSPSVIAFAISSVSAILLSLSSLSTPSTSSLLSPLLLNSVAHLRHRYHLSPPPRLADPSRH